MGAVVPVQRVGIGRLLRLQGVGYGGDPPIGCELRVRHAVRAEPDAQVALRAGKDGRRQRLRHAPERRIAQEHREKAVRDGQADRGGRLAAAVRRAVVGPVAGRPARVHHGELEVAGTAVGLAADPHLALVADHRRRATLGSRPGQRILRAREQSGDERDS